MTRVLSLALIALAVLGSATPGVWAQPAAPVPQVTITGFIDTVTSWNKNLDDSLVFRDGERAWYARNRGRFDVIGQLGQARAVLGSRSTTPSARPPSVARTTTSPRAARASGNTTAPPAPST